MVLTTIDRIYESCKFLKKLYNALLFISVDLCVNAKIHLHYQTMDNEK